MPITVGQLCNSNNYLYNLCMIAGENGLDNTVQWVHTLEDAEVAEFLHGGELVFTTGIAHKDSKWLLPFAKKLKDNGCSGIVVNLGPYIKELPEELRLYCSEVDFPLFTIPWEVHIVDISRDFCDRILQMSKQEESIGNALENMIFYPNDAEKYYQILERNGFDIQGNYCCIGIQIEALNEEGKRNYKYFTQMIKFKIFSFWDKTGTFTWKNTSVFVLCDSTEEARKNILSFLQQVVTEKQGTYNMKAGIGAHCDGILKLSQNYRRILVMFRLAERVEEKVLEYDELGVKKLLMSINDNQVISSYEEEILGKLKKYDAENNTNLMDLLRKYLECDGSIQQVVKEMYIHRNTVNYQIKKIKNILGCDMHSLEEKLQLLLAFHVHDIL